MVLKTKQEYHMHICFHCCMLYSRFVGPVLQSSVMFMWFVRITVGLSNILSKSFGSEYLADF